MKLKCFDSWINVLTVRKAGKHVFRFYSSPFHNISSISKFTGYISFIKQSVIWMLVAEEHAIEKTFVWSLHENVEFPNFAKSATTIYSSRQSDSCFSKTTELIWSLEASIKAVCTTGFDWQDISSIVASHFGFLRIFENWLLKLLHLEFQIIFQANHRFHFLNQGLNWKLYNWTEAVVWKIKCLFLAWLERYSKFSWKSSFYGFTALFSGIILRSKTIDFLQTLLNQKFSYCRGVSDWKFFFFDLWMSFQKSCQFDSSRCFELTLLCSFRFNFFQRKGQKTLRVHGRNIFMKTVFLDPDNSILIIRKFLNYYNYRFISNSSSLFFRALIPLIKVSIGKVSILENVLTEKLFSLILESGSW